MKTPLVLLALAAVQLFSWAADLTGTWKAEFDTQIGVQKYTFTFKQEGNNLTGRASSEIGGEKYESQLKKGRVQSDTVSFVEALNFQGNDLEIRYKGKLSAKEIKFTREVGKFATEELVAKLAAPAVDIAGPWRAEFDTPVGLQKYRFHFQVNDGNLTAKGAAETGDQKRDIEFQEAKLAGDTVTFVAVKAERESRALAGLSMGGGQSLNIGRGNLGIFAWIGGFSSAPNTNPPEQLVADPDKATKQLKLLYLSCGNTDGLICISQGVHAHLKEKNVPHIWHVDEHAHDFQHWKKGLYNFAQLIFKPTSK